MIGDFEKHSFFESAILDFLFFFEKKNLLHPHENWSKFLGYQEWVKIFMTTLVSSQKITPAKHFSRQCSLYDTCQEEFPRFSENLQPLVSKTFSDEGSRSRGHVFCFIKETKDL